MIKRLLRRIPAIVVLLAIAGFMAYGFWPTAERVELAKATRGDLTVTVSEDGKTRVREKYIVSAPVFGKLLRLELREGDFVRQGETVLAQIEPSDPALLDIRALAEAKARVLAADAALLLAEAALARAKEAHKLAKHDYDRARQLLDMRSISEAEFDKAEHGERIADADVRSAEFARKVATFELELAKAALIRTQASKSDDTSPTTLTILSPVNGQVLRVLQESADVVEPGTELVEIGDRSDLEMEIDVLSTDAVQIQPGAKVIVQHWGGEHSLEGAVRLVEPSAFLKVSALGVEEQRVNIIADFLNPLERRARLGDGYRVEVQIVAAEARDVLKVPTGTLFRQGDDWCVFGIANGRADQRRVEIGKTNGRETEIVKGLSEGEAVILHPTDKIQDGVRVRASL